MRIHAPMALTAGAELALPPEASRHVQVLRLQPGDSLMLFNGDGRDWPATVLHMGRQEVRVRLGEPEPVAKELPLAVHLAVVMPANDRMDFLVEKATELGAASIQPLMSERSVLRLTGERASKKQAHWQGVAAAAAGQCGRARLPEVHEPIALAAWLQALPARAGARAVEGAKQSAAPLRCVLSPKASQALRQVAQPLPASLTLLSGPEGGLSVAEEAQAVAAGFEPVGLGPRILRADTAPLAVLAWCALESGA